MWKLAVVACVLACGGQQRPPAEEARVAEPGWFPEATNHAEIERQRQVDAEANERFPPGTLPTAPQPDGGVSFGCDMPAAGGC